VTPEWHERGTCRQVDPELWFDSYPSKYDPVFQLCVECPVQVECLRQSFDNREEFGIWGGMSAHERERLIPKFRKKPYYERDTWITNLAARLRNRDAEVRSRKEATYQRQLEAQRAWREGQKSGLA
jgi:WhiB family redox-sensing transcriptional regulator